MEALQFAINANGFGSRRCTTNWYIDRSYGSGTAWVACCVTNAFKIAHSRAVLLDVSRSLGRGVGFLGSRPGRSRKGPRREPAWADAAPQAANGFGPAAGGFFSPVAPLCGCLHAVHSSLYPTTVRVLPVGPVLWQQSLMALYGRLPHCCVRAKHAKPVSLVQPARRIWLMLLVGVLAGASTAPPPPPPGEGRGRGGRGAGRGHGGRGPTRAAGRRGRTRRGRTRRGRPPGPHARRWWRCPRRTSTLRRRCPNLTRR